MHILRFVFILLTSFCHCNEISEEKIKNYNANPNKENLIELARLLRGIKLFSKTPAQENELYLRIQALIAADANHATYLEEKLESLRTNDSSNYYQSMDHRERFWMIDQTLSQIPTPEVVTLLGNYLYDERDNPPPFQQFQDWIDVEANSRLAVRALVHIGIKNQPVHPKKDYDDSDLATWKLWWEQVKAGTRTFSFEGKDIAYRFKKDGGYEVVSISEAQRINRESRVDMPKEQRIEEVRSISRQTWFIILTIFTLLIGLSWNKWRKTA